MQTESVLMQNLFVPCACRCRYCLLSSDGKPVGIPWDRSAAFALQFKQWLRRNRPELRFNFSFGYAMEHPELQSALRFLREIGSPQAEFLQCDGMKMRNQAECEGLSMLLAAEGVKHLNFTFYGLEEYHDRFSGRRGDFSLMLRMMRSAADAGLTVSAGIPLTAESAPQIDPLIDCLRIQGACQQIKLSVPHEEGRGITLNRIRFSENDLEKLSPDAVRLLNRAIYRPEREWVRDKCFVEETRRMLILSLRQDNIDRYEALSPGEIISEAEALDDRYYSAFPTLPELAEKYGDPDGRRFYLQRDLFGHYCRLFAEAYHISVYDVTDERQTGSRRY